MDYSEYNDIVKKLISNVIEHCNDDAELTLKACNDIVDYGTKVNDPKLMGFGYYHIAETYYCLNDGDNLFENISKAITNLQQAKVWELVARSYNILGITAMNRGNLPVALDYYLNGISYCECYDIPMVKTILDINCGVLNMQSGQFADAEAYLQRAYDYMSQHPEEPGYHIFMICIYQNMCGCKVLQGNFDGVDEIIDNIQKKHWIHADYIDKIGVLCSETLYYHRSNQHDLRDECIAQIDAGISENMALMDIFEDLYNYCQLLLECGDKDEEFWHVVDTLEPMIKSVNITNMHMKHLSLKIRWFRRNRAYYSDYLKSAGFYYELSERRENETMNMMNNVLQLRKKLEAADRARREVEVENQLLVDKSETDPLTQIPNRSKLNTFADEAFNRALARGTYFAIEILDIDFFKEYNDNYGHQAGDECLKKLANVLQTIARKYNGFCSRYGGDEFVLIYEDLKPEQMEQYCRELKEMVAGMGIEHKFSKTHDIVTISQGACCDIPYGSNKVWDFLHIADENLYQTKKTTRNNYCVSGKSK